MSGDDVAEIERAERELLEPTTRTDRARLETLLAPSFREVGASGTVYDREAIVAALAAEAAAPLAITVEALAVHPLGPDHALVTYASSEADGRRRAHRATIWARRAGGGWHATHHQGTLAA